MVVRSRSLIHFFSAKVREDPLSVAWRFRDEFELQKREEVRRARTAAASEKQSPKQAHKKVQLWMPETWDERLREQLTEEYLVYERLGMAEVLPEARTASGSQAELGLPRGSDLPLLKAIRREPDVVPAGGACDAGLGNANAAAASSTAAMEETTTSDDDYF